MTWPTFTALLASSTALLLSIGALLAAYLLLRLYRSTSCAKLSERLTAIESMHEELSAQVKAIRMARNMAAHRERKQAEAATQETDRPKLTQPKPAGFNHA